MATELATAYISLVPSMAGVQGAIAQQFAPAATVAGAAGDKAGASFVSRTKAQFGKLAVGLGAAFAGAKIARVFTDSVREASDLNESINAVRVTYGKAAKDILALGQTSAKGFGLSRSEFNGFAVQFQSFSRTIAGAKGDVTKTFGELIGRARDFASVMNLEVGQAAELFQSGLAGETEPLRKFGIDLSAAAVEAFAYANGIGTVGTELTESEKVQGRYGLLMEKTSKTAGDFANTSDDLANAQRILSSEWKDAKASIGTAFLPALGGVVAAINDKVIPALDKGRDKVKEFFGGIDFSKLKDLDGEALGKSLAAALGTALESLGSLVDQIGDVLGKVDWLGLGIKVGTQAIPFAIGLATGIINGITDPSVWAQIGNHLPQILLAVLAVAFAPAKLLGPVAALLGRLPLAGRFIESFLVGLNAAGGRVLGAIGGFLGSVGRSFAEGFGRINFPSLLPKFVDAIRLIPTRVGVFVLELGERLASGAGSIATRFGSAMRTGFDSVVAFFRGLPARFVSAFGSARSLLADVGASIVSGLLSGLSRAWAGITKWLSEKIAGLSAAAKKLLGIKSPSRVFMGIGENVGLGMALGLEAATPRIYSAVADMTAGRPGSFGSFAGAAGMAAAGPQIPITVNPSGQVDEVAIAHYTAGAVMFALDRS